MASESSGRAAARGKANGNQGRIICKVERGDDPQRP